MHSENIHLLINYPFTKKMLNSLRCFKKNKCNFNNMSQFFHIQSVYCHYTCITIYRSQWICKGTKHLVTCMLELNNNIVFYFFMIRTTCRDLEVLIIFHTFPLLCSNAGITTPYQLKWKLFSKKVKLSPALQTIYKSKVLVVP